VGIFDFLGLGKKEDPDEAILKRLKEQGLDLSKPHNIQFFISFPSQFTADKAAIRIKKSGFHVSIITSEKWDWVCRATKKMVPELSEIQNFRTEFGHLIETYNGKYDGWKIAEEK
jgi:regulator of RNase E activity RraB